MGKSFDSMCNFCFILVSMTLNPLGQLLLVGVPGKELTPETAALYRSIQPGGYILFGRNIESAAQLRKLIDDLRDLSQEEPIITIDQEGGRVSRLRLIGQEPPNASQLRAKGDSELIQRHGRITGKILRLFGFNLDLCPVLDIDLDEEADNSLRGRCYGQSVAEVIKNATIFNQALRQTGILSCGKHFPGYTHASLDPHHELPSVSRSREDLERWELAVFRAMADQVDSMMTGHIHFTGLEAEQRPASLSPAVTDGLLRGDLNYQGLIMTDDLDMGAILNHYGFDETMRLALAAGNDLLMLCHRVELAPAVIQALQTSPQSEVDRGLAAMNSFRKQLAAPTPFSENAFADLNQQIWDLRVATLGEELAAKQSPEDGKRSPVETY